MTALIRMRLVGYARTGRFIAPLLTCLVVLGTLYSGGRSPAGESYGVSGLVLFPVLAWQAKLLLDAEPDGQRRLAAVAVGSAARERSAGLLAAVAAALPIVVLGMLLPWLLAGIDPHPRAGEPILTSGIMAGVWVHLLIVPPAVVLGALASRPVTRTFGLGSMVLVGGGILTVVLGLSGSPLWWLAPPVMPATRAAARGFVAPDAAMISAYAIVWSVAAWLAYTALRRARA
jgi:hypothetical protein